ncbi:MAG: heparinase II/III family protein [Gemmatimonadaceae bacterium]
MAPARLSARMVGPSSFQFLNETNDVAPGGWDNTEWSKLWRYNLHYFDDLTAVDAASRADWHRGILERWVAENEPARGTAWEPFPTSRRIVNWIKWSLAGNELPCSCIESLGIQARWLARNLETHLLGNHLLANAQALVFSGAFFRGSEAESWLRTGLRILDRELREQVLADGGHFELSPMYHALVLESLLDLTNLAAVSHVSTPRFDEESDHWRQVIARMQSWLSAMTHPDGDIAFFNDAAFGVAPRPEELYGYSQRLNIGAAQIRSNSPTLLASSGYVRIDAPALTAMLDVGPIGPDYLPAHSHADTLSFELSLFGERVFVNSGTSLYEVGAERVRQRGTPAHNTVTIDHANSSEIWSSFRTGRRARPHDLEVTTGNETVVQCSHDGYSWLPGSPLHSRKWRVEGHSLVIRDQIRGPFRHAEARFRLHPRVTIREFRSEQGSPTTVYLRLPSGHEVAFAAHEGVLNQEQTTWHPEFGRCLPTNCLVVRFVGETVETHIVWKAPP